MAVASATKWVGGVLIMSLVEQNIIGLDDKLHKWLRFWPTNALDSRSKITVRETLAFTTGYTGETACPRMDPVVCAEKVLNDNFHLYPAGTHFSYSSDHLRLAAAVAVEAAGKSLYVLLDQYIFSRTTPAMDASSFPDNEYPTLYSGLITTPDDYEAFLSSYFKGELVSLEVRRAMETDQCPACTSGDFFKKRGHYGLGTWGKGCLGWGLADPSDPGSAPLPDPPWPIRCANSDEHWSSGAFGYWPETVTPLSATRQAPATNGTTAHQGATAASAAPAAVLAEGEYYFHMAMFGPGSDTAGELKHAVKPIMDALLSGNAEEARRLSSTAVAVAGAVGRR